MMRKCRCYDPLCAREASGASALDAILHYHHTRAVEPLERTSEWEMGEVEETFPSWL